MQPDSGLSGCPLFEPPEAVDQHVSRIDPAWRALFVAAACRLAADGRPSTVEDVTDVSGKPPAETPSAAGPMIKHLQKLGLIEWTGQWMQSRSVSRHTSPVRVWRGKRAA